MLIAFNAIVSFVISVLILRKSGTPKRHVMGFLLTAVLSGIVAFVSFQIFNPYGGVSSGARYHATLDSEFAWVVGLVAGHVAGALVANLLRPKAQQSQA
jgi:hypothetical protein